MAASTSDDALVRFTGVEKSYDGATLVVSGLDLAIRRGEFLTLLGPSGSGKTTTLMMLAGFEQPTRGDILVDGRSVTALPPHRRDIGVVFQQYALFPHMTVAENIAFPLSVRGMTRLEQEQAVAAALATVRLEGLGGRRPAQLSGGQQQRVALARALVFGPKLVLMDEPLGALDKQLREHMQLELKHLHDRLGLTVVYVTHDQDEALTMSDRVAVFHEGRVQQVDTPAQVYESPVNAFVAGFIGESNALAGTVERVHDTSCTVRLDDGGLVLARRGDVAGPGARATLSFRPERARLVAGTPHDDVNALPAELVETIYHGDHLRHRVRVGGAEITVKAPLDTRTPGDQKLMLSIRPEHSLALAPA